MLAVSFLEKEGGRASVAHLLWGDLTPFLRDTLQLERGHIEHLKETLAIIREHDEETYLHCRRVGDLAYHAGRVLGIDPKELFFAGVLHDFGKTSVPKETLQKKGLDFTDEDYERVKPHALAGYLMLKESYPFAAEILLRHHCFQQKPYPDFEDLLSLDARFNEKEKSLIERCAQILALVDFYDASTTRRDRHNDGNECVHERLVREYPLELETISMLFHSGIFHHQKEDCYIFRNSK